jgi:hypothetical protein
MSIQSTREGEKVSSLREELETQIENSQRDHQDKVEDILELSEERIVGINEDL